MKFSIIVPVYKPDFLQECIDSILTQSYQDFELILVNDASPYDVDAVVFQYTDLRIQYHKRDIGFGALRLVDNWNDCLKYAKGDYVLNMGDDDCLEVQCLEDYINVMNDYPNLDVYHTRMVIIDEHSETYDLQEERPRHESAYSMFWHFLNLKRDQKIGDWLISRKKLLEIGGYFNLPCAWATDTITPFIASLDKGIANSQHIGFMYRESRVTITKRSNFTYPKLDAWLQLEIYLDQFFSKPVNGLEKLDILYFKLIKEIYPKRINKWKIRDVNCYKGGISLLDILFFPKKYKLSKKKLFFYWLKHFGNKSAL